MCREIKILVLNKRGMLERIIQLSLAMLLLFQLYSGERVSCGAKRRVVVTYLGLCALFVAVTFLGVGVDANMN